MKNYTFFLRTVYLCATLLSASAYNLQAQNPVDSWTIASTPATDQDTYTIGGDIYQYGQGNNVEITSVTYNGDVFTIPFSSQFYVFRRVDITPNVNGTNVTGNKASVFYERTGASNFIYEASLPGTPGNIDLETILKLPVINRGVLDVFKNQGTNSGDEGPSNIERVDVVFPALTIANTGDLNLNGFLASEKNGNNTFKAAAILTVDGSGNPTSYGNLVTIVANTSYGEPTVDSYNPSRVNAFNEDSNSDNQPIRVGGGSERMGLTLITFADLGITAGQTFYGISFFGDDVVDSDNLLDPTTFPQDTDTGADIYGALGAIVTATGFVPPLDSDGDLVADDVDLDDDNDGILDTVECNLDEIDFASLGTAVATRLDPGDPDASFTNYISGEPLNRTITISAPAVKNGAPSDFFVGSESNTVLRFEDSSGFNTNDAYGSTLTFNLPSIPYFSANNTLGASNINQSDSFTFTAINESPTANIWTVISSSSAADIVINGNSITVKGSGTSGTGGAAPYAEFQIIANVSLDQVEIIHTNLSNLGSLNSGRLSVQLCSDTDGDGVQDTLDIDSDNDGCADAIEAAGSFTTADLTTDDNLANLPTDVDADGIPNVGSQATVAAVIDDADDTACAPAVLPDNDDDGVPDSIDLDDDNDGILDIDEGICTTFTPVVFPSAADGTLSGSGGSVDYDIILNTSGNAGYGTVSYNGNATGLEIDHADDSNNPDSFSYRVEFTNLTSGYNQNVRISQSIFSTNGNNEASDWTLSWVGGEGNAVYQDPISSDSNNYKGGVTDPNFDINNGEIDGLATTGAITNGGVFRTFSVSNSKTEWYIDLPKNITEFTITKTILDGTIAISPGPDTGFDGGYPNYNLNDAEGNDGESVREWLGIQVSLCEDLDTDGDNIPNYLDLDSDGDGILDTVEAQLPNNFFAPGAVDPITGIPVIGTDTDGIDPITSDGDPLPDYLDIDSDDDGISDAIEKGVDTSSVDFTIDTDRDGIPDDMDASGGGTDANNNGIIDGFEPVDTDGDLVPDYLDLDSDNDGIYDTVEAGFGANDTNNDGRVSSNPTIDVNGNGQVDAFEAQTPPNTVTSTPANFINTDSDGDGCSDADEGYFGTVTDADSDNDGLYGASPITTDPLDGTVDSAPYNSDNAIYVDSNTNICLDTDNDGIPDLTDLDDDNDGIPDTVEGTNDTDGDGIQDYLDLDSDNDGIPDIIEAGGIDTDGDGQIDYPTPGDPMSMNDTNNDGLDDGVAGAPLPDADSDNDGLVDRLDLDADNDGITDIIEAGGTDANADGQVDYATPGDPMTMVDVDGDGFIDTIDTDDNTVVGTGDGGTALPDSDTDGDSFPNRLDLDADNDGIHDVIESGGTDTDGNGTADDDDDNVNNTATDGIPTSAGGGITPTDTGADASPDYVNLDSDADGCSDANEAYANANADGGDGGQYGTGSPAAIGATGLVAAATYDTGVVAAVTNAADATACDTLDSDNDGIIDSVDLDDDNDGIPDTVEGTNDTDGDGIQDYLDLDSDNDGIPDIIEAGGIDTDGDGQIDYPTPGDPMSMNDTNNDGLDDGVAGAPLPDADSDNDGLVDRLDLDADNDGITDIIEADGTDANADGQVDYATPGDPMTMVDVDGDGFIDTIDTDDNTVIGVGDGGTALPDSDTDGDSFPNRLDLDSDNDGIHDVIESGGTDTNSNGTADDDDDNANNTATNGIPTSAGGGNIPTDTGADASPDYLNLDSDADGCSDANEAYASATADGGDGGQFGTGTPAAIGANGLVAAATYDTGLVAAVTDDTDVTACDVIDADGDGVLDDQELTDGTDPNDPCDFVIASITETQGGDWLTADCDGDGVTNEQEIIDGTNPEDSCDFDAANITLAQSGDYLILDCDGDGVTNGTEITDGTNPDDPCDLLEASITLSPTENWITTDCDGDTIPNGQEIVDGTDPYDPCSSIGGTPPAGANCDMTVTIESDLVNPGINDGIFQINNIELFPNTVRIYNRWGILVFKTKGYDNNSNAFRGISNGRSTINIDKELPVGVYFYIIEYVEEGVSNTMDGYLYVNR